MCVSVYQGGLTVGGATVGGPESGDVAGASKNKVTIITAVARKKQMSVEAKKGELMESNMDAMEVLLSHSDCRFSPNF